MKPKYPVLFFVLLSAAVFAWAGNGRNSMELAMIEQEAHNGEPGAELLYGLSLLEGRYDLRVNVPQALGWLRRAAKNGNSFAALTLGDHYANTAGTDHDPAQAVVWWRQAAEAGNAKAQYQLGKAYLEGNGVARNDMKAADWLERSANNGDTAAQYLLGKMYHEGYAVVQDQTLARDWLSRAAASGHSDAINLLAVINTLIKSTTLVSQASPEALIEEARDGDPHAQYELGLRYENGFFEGEQNPTKALFWLRKAANNGNLLAMHKLSEIYARGLLGVGRNATKAAYWEKKAKGKRAHLSTVSRLSRHNNP